MTGGLNKRPEIQYKGLNKRAECNPALTKLVFHFLSYLMGYDHDDSFLHDDFSFIFNGYGHGDSFPFDFEPNGIAFGSKSEGKLSP